ncbi:MAG: OmpA family protein, partial [Deltaproteobacteria bacterium]
REPLRPASFNEAPDDDRREEPVVTAPTRVERVVAPAAFDALAATDPDADSDGVALPGDQCPNEPEDRDGYLDSDGCPDPDNDGDGVIDADDKCPDEQEVINGVDDGDGCPDEGAPLVSQVGPQITISERIQFKSGGAELTDRSKSVLDQVAAVLQAHAEIDRVRIEGHTDSFGDREFNVDLAERRAWSVRAYLIERGVAEKRLFAKGFGPTRPVATNRTEAGRAENRRVEFHVVAPGEPIEGEVRR